MNSETAYYLSTRQVDHQFLGSKTAIDLVELGHSLAKFDLINLGSSLSYYCCRFTAQNTVVRIPTIIRCRVFQNSLSRFQLHILIPIRIVTLDLHSLADAKFTECPDGFKMVVITVAIEARQDSNTQPPNYSGLADAHATGSKIAAAITDFHRVSDRCNPVYLTPRHYNLLRRSNHGTLF